MKTAILLCVAVALAGPQPKRGGHGRQRRIRVTPLSDDSLRAAAELLTRRGELEDAIDIYDDLRSRSPDDPDLLEAEYAVCIRAPACSGRMIELTDEVLRLASDRPDLIEDLYSLLLGAHRVDQAFAAVKEYVARNPDDAGTWTFYVESLIDNGRQDVALDEIGDRLAEHGSSEAVHQLRADLLEDLRRFEELDEALAAFAGAKPESRDAWTRVGERALEHDDLDVAAAAVEKARAGTGDHPDTLRRLEEVARELEARLTEEHEAFRAEVIWADFEDDLEYRDDY